MAAISLFNGGVSVDMRVPEEINAGKEFLVDITLEKSDVESFARFQQELPQGMSVQVLQASDADYRFEDNKVKFVWLSLPAKEKISLMYKVKVNDRLKGKFALGGKFSYISQNTRRHVDVRAVEVNIVPDASINPNLLVDVNEFKELVPLKKTSPSWNYVSCIRQLPFIGPEGKDLIVNLLVSKGDKEKFAKIEENIPEGYIAESIEAKDGIFTYKDGVVKFLWMNLPADPNYIVSYKLIPQDGADLNNLNVNGTFSFIEKEQTQSIDIVQREANLLQLDPEQINNIVTTTGRKIQKDYPIKGASSSYTGGPDAEGGVDIPVGYVGIKDKKKTLGTVKAVVPYNENKLTLDEGVYYRVQIAAGHKLVNIKRYFRKYKFTEEVKTERLDGWIKYSVGSFPVYMKARDYRNVVWNEKGINDAFVSAYNSGQRITVQEALMISNQKWYK